MFCPAFTLQCSEHYMIITARNMGVDIGRVLTRAFIKMYFISAPRGPIGTQLPPRSHGAKLSSLHNSINFNISSSDQFAIFRYRTSAYHARQTIIMHALYSVMASAHALERFWNSKRSHCMVGPFWNGNFCRSVLERFGREWSCSHCD